MLPSPEQRCTLLKGSLWRNFDGMICFIIGTIAVILQKNRVRVMDVTA